MRRSEASAQTHKREPGQKIPRQRWEEEFRKLESSKKKEKKNKETQTFFSSFKMFIKNIFLFACKHSPATLTA